MRNCVRAAEQAAVRQAIVGKAKMIMFNISLIGNDTKLNSLLYALLDIEEIDLGVGESLANEKPCLQVEVPSTSMAKFFHVLTKLPTMRWHTLAHAHDGETRWQLIRVS